MLTREQIDALSDDPEEPRRQLMDIAGPNATILVDSFEGRELPPKALFESIPLTLPANPARAARVSSQRRRGVSSAFCTARRGVRS